MCPLVRLVGVINWINLLSKWSHSVRCFWVKGCFGGSDAGLYLWPVLGFMSRDELTIVRLQAPLFSWESFCRAAAKCSSRQRFQRSHLRFCFVFWCFVLFYFFVCLFFVVLFYLFLLLFCFIFCFVFCVLFYCNFYFVFYFFVLLFVPWFVFCFVLLFCLI